jgi:microcin C transport system substrate-binding protein
MNTLITVIAAAGFLAAAQVATFAADDPPVAAAPAAETANVEPVTLPADVVWETNEDDPLIGSPKAIRGGTLNMAIGAYPLTLRIMGPNNNDAFASWNRAFSQSFTLVQRHPVTDKYIPMLATHWSIQKDQKTIYLKLDPDVKFSDGHPVTADDYVFTWKMMQSKFIVDPFYNSYAEQYYQSVDKIDDYTLRIVGTRPSWRPLTDYAELWPTPAHATVLDKDWVTRTTNQPQIVVGPYVISNTERGQSVTFKRVPNWWGDKKRYFTGLYNFDEIHLRVIPSERVLDYVRNGELDLTQEPSAKNWHEIYTFPAVTNGWLRRVRTFVEWSSGVTGIQMNLEDPILQNRDFRIGIQYLIDFDRLNKNIWYNEYYRITSFFEGTEYANPEVRSYGFNPTKAREAFERAGFHRPDADRASGFLAKVRNVAYGLIFTHSDMDDILVNDKGQKASFSLIYASKSSESALTIIQQDFRRAGIDMRLQQFEGGTMFEHALERKYETAYFAMTSGFYPDPRQYLGTEFKNTKNNNDFWGFGTKEVDDLIKTYEESLDLQARKDALFKVDQIVHDEAFYVPMQTAPYIRLVFWDYIQFPEFYLPKRTEQVTDWMVYWVDPKKKAALAEAMRDNKPYPLDPDMDKDYYGVRKNFQ